MTTARESRRSTSARFRLITSTFHRPNCEESRGRTSSERRTVGRVLASTTAAVVLLGALAGPAHADPQPIVGVTNHSCFPIAHRAGATKGIDENTSMAIRRDGRIGAWAEVDARRLTSGGIVLMHDKTVKRTTNGTGFVEELDLTYIKSLRTEPNGQPVPTLKEAMDAASRAGTTLYVELKEYREHWTSTDLLKVRKLVSERDLWDQVYLGGTRAALKALEDTTPRLKAFWRTKNNDQPTAPEADKRSVEVVQTGTRRVTLDEVQSLRQAGYIVAHQSANTPEQWSAAKAVGITIMQVNAPSRYLNWCDEQSDSD